MKSLLGTAFKKLIDDFNPAVRKNQNGVQAEAVSKNNPGRDEDPADAADRRAVERSRKGIFACPRFVKFFSEDNDILIN